MTRVHQLSESITHVEDLPVGEFIDVLRNMSSMVAQEKLDGANLWIGVDEEARFFTSREGKKQNSERRYSVEEWPKVSAFNQFRAAHAALDQVQGEIKRTMRSGDMVEAEVLFGRQPNSVTYGANGKSYIAFLRGINNTPDTIAEHLAQVLNGKTVDVNVELVESGDGDNLEMTNTPVSFQFTQPQQIDPSKLKGASGIDKELKRLESFLRSKSPIAGMTNSELAQVQLTSIPKEQREAVKAARTEVLAKIQTDYKLPIKASLLDKVVRTLRSHLTDQDVQPNEDTGIEGIVLRDPSTGNQVKVVDKDIFTTINKFNQAARAQIQGALNTTDPQASVEARGGLVGIMRIRIAEFFGNRELAKGSNLRKVLEPIKGKTAEDAIRNLAAALPNNDDPEMVKKKVLAIIADTAAQLKTKLEEFKENKEAYRLRLKNGKELGLSGETIKKTLVSFAEARRNLTDLFDKVKATKSVAQILAIFYGGQAKTVHQKDEDELKESFMIVENKGEVDMTEYDRKDLFELVNCYLATVFMTMAIYHTDDIIGIRKLRDRPNYLLKKHKPDMSQLNHWGYPIWRPARPELAKHLTKKTVAELAAAVKQIPAAWWKFLHMDFSWTKDRKIEWTDHRRTLRRLIDLTGLRTDRLNTLLDEFVGFADLDYAGRKSALKRLITYAHRFVPRSSLLLRIRDIEKKLTDSKEEMVAENLFRSITRLTEEGEGGDAGAGGQATSVATTASAVATTPVRIGAMRTRTELRTRNPEVKNLMKKFKDPRKQRETQ